MAKGAFSILPPRPYFIYFNKTNNVVVADCKCAKVIGHLEAVRWQLQPRDYRPSAGALALGNWARDHHVWLHYVPSSDGLLPDDDVLRSTDTRYWSIHDVQRYSELMLHCENVLFTCQYPTLRLPSRLGAHFWGSNAALKLPTRLYLKEFHRALETTLMKMQFEEAQMDRLIISDQIVNVNCLDYFKRKTFFRLLNNILSFQDRLQLVSLENLCCSRLEGARLLQQLACFAAHSLKYLFLWRFVLPNENPIVINYSYITGSGQYIPRPETRRCFLRSLGELRNLRVLALEYAHLADATGGALISLITVLKRPHMRLQLMCREDQIPGRADQSLGTGGYVIPDLAWRRVATTCSDLYLLMTFCRIRNYDDIRRFLSPSIPLREAHFQLGIDLTQSKRQDSDVSCLVRHLAFNYASTLAALSIHQWRFAVFPLRRVFELMPRLVRFFYVGSCQDEVDLKRMLHIIACGVCDKLKHLKIQIQDEMAKRDYWKNVIENILEEYKDIMQVLEIRFELEIYKS
ncbi:uncharacterized protein LOC134755103 [Cydia strobilella]|uniref:uncharacterized protein LOC134755103 n=1 Tax=Cydia strobilella TaxID=1100964 RepID=UPI003005CCF2